MLFNKHHHLKGAHSFLSPSKPHWLGYDEAKLEATYRRQMAAQRGTELHEVASKMIDLRIKLPETKKTFNLYVNDCIGYGMKTEQTLFYSNNCFGTADAISYSNKILRIFDLKTGVSPTSMRQLETYAAIFCLEYSVTPWEVEDFDLRIYQSDRVLVHNPERDDIIRHMDKIVHADKLINSLKSEMNNE